ncbi:MAG TPA: hypothetical protein VNB30_03580 [Rhizomicrobium sp.]|jgi:hypothetical protein|nr:hypothetical protein [Rhizomicrobium sp.]
MSLEQASLISQIISAVAILASLVFLIFQIRGNTRALRSQSYFNGMTHGQRPFEMMIADEDLTRIVNIGYNSPDALPKDDRERFNLHTFMLVNSWEYFFYQHRDGSIPSQLFAGTDAHMRVLVRTKPGLRVFWDEYRHAYDEPFLSYVAAIFDERSPT